MPSGRSTHKHKSMSNMTCQGYHLPFLFYLLLECRSTYKLVQNIICHGYTFNSLPRPCGTALRDTFYVHPGWVRDTFFCFHITRSVPSRTLASENVLRYNFVCSVSEIRVKSELEARLIHANLTFKCLI